MNPPKQLWQKGRHDGYETAVLEVRICKDAQNQLWSVHNWQSREDEALSHSWPEGGAKQVAHALLTEALRREVYALVLGELTRDQEMISKYSQADAAGKAEIEKRLEQSLPRMVLRMTEKMGPGLVQEILAMVEKASASKRVPKE